MQFKICVSVQTVVCVMSDCLCLLTFHGRTIWCLSQVYTRCCRALMTSLPMHCVHLLTSLEMLAIKSSYSKVEQMARLCLREAQQTSAGILVFSQLAAIRLMLRWPKSQRMPFHIEVEHCMHWKNIFTVTQMSAMTTLSFIMAALRSRYGRYIFAL